ncbi:hypothetical protein, partial [Escherichia coli]|uniref:hypothetical protein n=1 Tax=Escherichia coli TaxID=562 RepID=UPI0030C67CBA
NKPAPLTVRAAAQSGYNGYKFKTTYFYIIYQYIATGLMSYKSGYNAVTCNRFVRLQAVTS